MIKNKEQLIAEQLSKPFKVGDEVYINVPYVKVEHNYAGKGKKRELAKTEIGKEYSTYATVLEILKDNYILVKIDRSYSSPPSELSYNYDNKLKIESKFIKHLTSHIGANPFVEMPCNSRIQFYQSDIEQVLWRVGYDRREKVFKNEKIGDVVVPEIDFDPIIERDGVDVPYQRGLVWDLKQKQLLIDSIYNNIEIGKVVIRKRSWRWVEDRIKKGIIEHTTFGQIVDGLQRISTLLAFINNEFQDSFGNFFKDLSADAQRKFFNFRSVTFGELGEEATDEDVLNVFLGINHTGTPMSEEHINYVKSLRK